MNMSIKDPSINSHNKQENEGTIVCISLNKLDIIAWRLLNLPLLIKLRQETLKLSLKKIKDSKKSEKPVKKKNSIA